MNKLINVFLFVGILFSSTFSDTWKSIIFDNVINDISVQNGKIYLATEGGISVVDTTGMWCEYHKTVTNGLYSNYISSVLVRPDNCIFAMGYDWVSWNPKDYPAYWSNVQLKETPKHSIGYDLALGMVGDRSGIWAALSDGVYLNGGGKWVKTIDHIAYRITLMNNVIWGTFSEGIFSYNGSTKKIWKVGEELIAGQPLDIASWDDGVVAIGENGCYVFSSDTTSSPWILAYDDNMPKHNKYSVAYFKGQFYIAQGNALWVFDSKWEIVETLFYSINCLEATSRNLYIGTDNGLAVWDGKKVDSSKYGRIKNPHDNHITHIAIDNSGLILAGGFSGGYRYDIDKNSPSLNNLAENVYGYIKQSFVDSEGGQWIGYNNSLKRDNVIVISNDSSLINKYWLVGDADKKLWLLTSSPVKLLSYAGDGTWSDRLDLPERLKKQKILSVNSTGKHLWIATDSTAFFYDFKGKWLHQELGYNINRKMCGDESLGSHGWVATADSLYSIGGSGVTFHGPCPWKNRIINDIVFDYNIGDNAKRIWVATDSGVYCATAAGKIIDIPMNELADKFVNKIFIDRSSGNKRIWFGTAGGLTVLHKENPTKTIEKKTGFNNNSDKNNFFFSKNKLTLNLRSSGDVSVRLYNLAGREIATLINGYKNAGRYFISLRGFNIGRGNYLCTLQTKNFEQVKKIKIL